jgi:hypothetical protein
VCRTIGGATLLWVLALAAPCGCDRSGNTRPKTPPAPPPPRLTLLVPESADWTAAEAVTHLDDGRLAVSAAVRLVRLDEAEPLCVPEEFTDATASRLQVVPLADGLWALGLFDERDGAALHAPMLIDADGAVHILADGTEEELLVLRVSADADVYPHLLVAPRRVWLATVPPQLALTLDTPEEVGFRGWVAEGRGYVALMIGAGAGYEEVAQYYWEPYELAFQGPASDVLPDPPGGKFVLDMEQSPLLIPRGGEIPPPKERTPPGPAYRPGIDA